LEDINDINVMNLSKNENYFHSNNCDYNDNKITSNNLISITNENTNKKIITNPEKEKQKEKEKEKEDSKEIFFLQNFKEESREIIEEYICQICKCIALKPILLSKKNKKNKKINK
jgi:hypothetical protein